jgi:hypothetical protein
MLTEYSEGLLPLDFELDSIAVDTILKRQIAFIGRSKQWQDEPIPGREEYNPLMIRYEGNRIMKWGRKGDEVFWGDAETPKFQG